MVSSSANGKVDGCCNGETPRNSKTSPAAKPDLIDGGAERLQYERRLPQAFQDMMV